MTRRREVGFTLSLPTIQTPFSWTPRWEQFFREFADKPSAELLPALRYLLLGKPASLVGDLLRVTRTKAHLQVDKIQHVIILPDDVLRSMIRFFEKDMLHQMSRDFHSQGLPKDRAAQEAATVIGSFAYYLEVLRFPLYWRDLAPPEAKILHGTWNEYTRIARHLDDFCPSFFPVVTSEHPDEPVPLFFRFLIWWGRNKGTAPPWLRSMYAN